MDEIKTLLEQAATLAREGKIEESRAMREQATELRKVKEEEMAVKTASTPPVDTANRLPFGTPEPEKPEVSAFGAAVKSAYITKYKEIEPATEQVLKELYASTGIKNVDDYYTLHNLKYRDLTRYCKTGNFDPRLKSLMLYTPGQIVHGIMAGVPVEEGGFNFPTSSLHN